MFRRLIISLFFICFMTILPLSAQTSPQFDREPCPLELPYGYNEDAGVNGIECGFVTVPEFHANPTGNQIRVAVAIIHSSSPNPFDDPVFMEQGGPGGSTFELFLPNVSLFEQILGQRDIILVEQRGTLYSEPSLTCPEILEQSLELISQPPSASDPAAPNGAYQRCFQRLAAEGVNLSAFNSVENAADIISVADALNYDEINFYGVSYGTMLGQHLLRDFEDRIRSIILDAVVPLELNFLPDTLATANEALDVVFQECAAIAACNRRYPNLETITFDTVATLNANPVLIPIYNPETGQEYGAYFSGDVFLNLLRSVQYRTDLVPSIPAFIDAASTGDFEWAERLYSGVGIVEAQTFADAMYVSVICAEDADFSLNDINIDNIRAEFVSSQLLSLTSILSACELAQVDVLDNYVDLPVESDVPMLIFSGQFDPITPSRYANLIASNFPNATNLSFAGIGHGAIFGGYCPLTIASQFLFNPEVPVDTGCTQLMGIDFYEFTNDPTGRLQFPIPPDLTDVSTSRYASYQNAFGDLIVSVIAVTERDLDVATAEALTNIVGSDFVAAPLEEFIEHTPFGDVLTSIYVDDYSYVLTVTSTIESVTSVVVIEFSPDLFNDAGFYLYPLASNMYSID
ncbi:MAG: alpha/beta hydrolase [Phototrophicaceae bacterium]